MRERVTSSLGVVLVGLIPAMLGGPIFALVFLAVVAIGASELFAMLQRESFPFRWQTFSILALCVVIPLLWRGDGRLPLITALLALLPLTAAVFARRTNPARDWAMTTAVVTYLGLPAFAAVDLRERTGSASGWLDAVAGWLPLGRAETGFGLGWLLLAILVTWFADSGAFIVGRSVGRRKLIPRISPNKTIEGAVGGLAASAVAALLCSAAFGLELPAAHAALLGVALGLSGIVGDLAESMLKRHAGIKDSGSLIPGHGGILDRIDALLFVLVVTWAAVPILA